MTSSVAVSPGESSSVPSHCSESCWTRSPLRPPGAACPAWNLNYPRLWQTLCRLPEWVPRGQVWSKVAPEHRLEYWPASCLLTTFPPISSAQRCLRRTCPTVQHLSCPCLQGACPPAAVPPPTIGSEETEPLCQARLTLHSRLRTSSCDSHCLKNARAGSAALLP